MHRRTFLLAAGAAAAAGPIWPLLRGGAASAAPSETAGTSVVGGTTMRPPAVPLAVRGPYVSTWQQSTDLVGVWPRFWTNTITGLCGMARIDGRPYLWAGAPSDSIRPTAMTQTALEVTPTRSLFTFAAGGVELGVEWLSPVEPGDLRRQSVPLTLLTVTARATDGRSHRVAVYADVSGEWASGTPTDRITWSTTTTGQVRTWTYRLATQQPFAEHNGVAAWGDVVWATHPRGNGLTYQSGRDVTVRDRFVRTGVLGDSDDPDHRAINQDWPVFAFAHELTHVTATAQEVSMAIGHVRTPLVRRWEGHELTALWRQYWDSPQAMAAWFLGDAASARSRAVALDARITAAATAAGGADNAALCALSLRQAYGACELAVGAGGKPWALLKEVSSGSFVNTADVIYPAMPVWLYLDPGYLAMLLRPLLAYAASDVWPHPWAPHDLGRYPDATSSTGGVEQMPIEETAGMLIMAAAYAKRVGAATAKPLLAQYAALWSTWAGYLANPHNLPDPPEQLTTDDFAGPITGSVNLAVKGVIGLAAAAQIATLLGDTANATSWRATATSYAARWRTASMDAGGAHLDLTEGAAGTWGNLYNAYADTLLGTGLVPASLAATQAAWYEQHLDAYGLALQSTTPDWSKADWNAWTAAWLRDSPVAARLRAAVVSYLTHTPERVPFGDFYDPATATLPYQFRARPVVGGTFALLALA